MSAVPTWVNPHRIAAIAGAAVILLVTLLLPLGFDNDVYESMAWTLYAYHGAPYLASWDMNFPGIVFIHWASIALFGASDSGFRLFDYFAHVGMAGLFYTVLVRWLQPREALVAVLIFALYYAGGLWGLAGQRDEYAVFVLLIGILAFFTARKSDRPIWPLIAGIACGCAMLVRPTYVFFTLSFLWCIGNRSGGVQRPLCFVLGCALPWIAFILPYVLHPNGVAQVYDSIIRYNLDFYSSVRVPVSVFTLGRGCIYCCGLLGIVLQYSGRTRDPNLDPRDRTFLYALAVSSLLSPIVMGKYFTYHFAPFMMFAVSFAAIGVVRLTDYLRSPFLQWSGIGLALAIFATLYYPRHLLRYYFEERTGDHPLEATYERVLADSMIGLHAQHEVVHYITARTATMDTVEFVSFFPSLRWRLARPAATRFTTPVPLVTPDSLAPDYIREWKNEFIERLVTVRPQFILVSQSHEWWPFVNDYADRAISNLSGFESVLRSSYSLDTNIRGFRIYRRL